MYRRTKRWSGFFSFMRSPLVTTKGCVGIVCIGHDRGGWWTDRNRNWRRRIRCDKVMMLRWRRKSKQLMRSITSTELPIAECKSSGTVHFNYVLIVILDFRNRATTIPTCWEATSLILDEYTISHCKGWKVSGIFFQVFKRFYISSFQGFFFKTPCFSPTVSYS